MSIYPKACSRWIFGIHPSKSQWWISSGQICERICDVMSCKTFPTSYQISYRLERQRPFFFVLSVDHHLFLSISVSVPSPYVASLSIDTHTTSPPASCFRIIRVTWLSRVSLDVDIQSRLGLFCTCCWLKWLFSSKTLNRPTISSVLLNFKGQKIHHRWSSLGCEMNRDTTVLMICGSHSSDGVNPLDSRTSQTVMSRGFSSQLRQPDTYLSCSSSSFVWFFIPLKSNSTIWTERRKFGDIWDEKRWTRFSSFYFCIPSPLWWFSWVFKPTR